MWHISPYGHEIVDNRVMTIRIGIVSTAPVETGGAATYDRAIQKALSDVSESVPLEVVRFGSIATADQVIDSTSQIVRYTKHPHGASRLQKLVGYRGSSRRNTVPSLQQALSRERISLAWFLAPNRVISSVVSTPFVMSVWDLAHREVQGFPEFSADRRWTHRESMYSENVGRAFHVLTDSRRTGENLERIYGVYPENWSSIGLPLPPQVGADFSLARQNDHPYFYYPASFWPHKNHRVLIDALGLMREKKVDLVFSGHDEGHASLLKNYVEEMGLGARVRFLGRIGDAEVQGLIENSIAVLMPTVLGPTNYPPLEALRSSVPCIVSHVHEFDYLPKSGMVVVDAHDPRQWSQAMAEMLGKGRPVVNPARFVAPEPHNQIAGVVEKFQQVMRVRLGD